MTRTAACTIISLNYLPFARVLCESYVRHHPESRFFVLLVDRLDPTVDFSDEKFMPVWIEELAIPDFFSIAFKYDTLELNTNVKPTFLKKIFRDYDVDRLFYFDPDIYIYNRLDDLLEKLDSNSVLLTPHICKPIEDNLRPSEQDFLVNGVFNLGFIGLSKTMQTLHALNWWERRCLELGFSEPRSGLFVDQKWLNLAPCLFEDVFIVRDARYNMAYWNLQERRLSGTPGKWIVNDQYPLAFYHFSGIDVESPKQISKHQNRFDLTSRPDLNDIFAEYRQKLRDAGALQYRNKAYSFGTYSNGEPITSIARRAYAANLEGFNGIDPFDASGQYYRWSKKRGLLGTKDTSGPMTSLNLNPSDLRLKVIHSGMRLALRLLGTDRYTALMKYFSWISILRNQVEVFGQVSHRAKLRP